MKKRRSDVLKKITMLLTAFTLLLSFNSVNAKAQTVASPTTGLQEQNTMSVLWFQKAGEAKALFYQGYNIGKLRLDEYLNNKAKKKGLKPAVVLDIDETILDNSPYQAWNIVNDKDLTWDKWIKSTEGKPLPGALDFLKYADSKGIAIFYISNRKEAQKEATIKNLQHVGAPQADVYHVLLKQPNEQGKETRRQQVAKSHEIVLLFGDNLGDFSGFDGLSVSERMKVVDRHKDEFGKKLIVFPNPMYGDWEGAIYNYNYKKSNEDKAKLRKENLMPFKP
jgi:5'-nucleotidase (lipoprotein e(P4) family)